MTKATASLRNLVVAGSLSGSAACTPLGLWIYKDPGVTVSRVRVSSDSAFVPVLIALDLQNPNDYDLSATHVELSLELDDLPIGELNRDSTVEMPGDTTSTVALPLDLAAEVPVARLTTLKAGTHRFAVMGRAEFKTPIGKRQVRFAQQGDLKFGPATAGVSARPGG
jgi:LEA14-like dessication related protein